MILLLLLALALILGGITGHYADSRDPRFQLGPVARHRLRS